MTKNVFIAGPFTNALNRSSKFDNIVKEHIEYIIEVVISSGHKYFSAHMRENWGVNLDSPDSLAQTDINEMRHCSHLIVYWGKKISIGVCIEIGFAIACNKPVLLIKNINSIESDFYKGLISLGHIKEVHWNNNEQIINTIKDFLN